jgi:hypothetical protein
VLNMFPVNQLFFIEMLREYLFLFFTLFYKLALSMFIFSNVLFIEGH